MDDDGRTPAAGGCGRPGAPGEMFGTLPAGMDATLAGELDADLSAAFAALDAGFAALDEVGRRGDLRALGRDRLIGVAQRLEGHRSRLATLDSWVVEAARTEELADHLAARSLPSALAQVLRISRATASARVRTAEQLLPVHHFSAGLGEPELPILAEAVREGRVSGDQLGLISRTMRRLSTNPNITGEDAAQAEAALVAHAAVFGPAELQLIAERIDAALLPDGTLPPEAMTAARRGVRIGALRRDGTHSLTGNLTRELAARLHAVLDPLAAPRPADDESGADPRSAAQRTHDALDDAMARLLDSPGLPRTGGTPATVHLILDAEHLLRQLDRYTGNPDYRPDQHLGDLPDRGDAATSTDPGPGTQGATRGGLDLGPDRAAGTGEGDRAATLGQWDWLQRHRIRAATSNQRVIGHTSSGISLTLADVTDLAAEALLVPVWMSGSGGVLGYGRVRRICTPAMTEALIARDRGCSFPGCDAPPEWCERHHVIEWAYGGRTDLDNLTLTCRYHHARFAQLGWRVTIYGGLPVWIPPAILDRRQHPLRNLRITDGHPGAPPERDAVHAKAAADEAQRHGWRIRGGSPPGPGREAASVRADSPATSARRVPARIGECLPSP